MSPRNVSAATRAAFAEVNQLRAELERVTAERDTERAWREDKERLLCNTERELAETKAALESSHKREEVLTAEWHKALYNAKNERLNTNEARAELYQLQREWALRELETTARIPRDEAWLRNFPATVAALIRSAAADDCHIGQCKCGVTVPLKRVPLGDYGDSEDVCAPGWCCSEKGASDGG